MFTEGQRPGSATPGSAAGPPPCTPPVQTAAPDRHAGRHTDPEHVGPLRYRRARGWPAPMSERRLVRRLAARTCAAPRPVPGRRRRHRTVVSALVVVLVSVTALGLDRATSQAATPVSHPSSDRTLPGLVDDPAGLVDPMDGTGTGAVTPGTIAEFPGADLPFGMIQWSPDTVPDRVGSGGGYSYADSAINGFSLTHLSGVG